MFGANPTELREGDHADSITKDKHTMITIRLYLQPSQRRNHQLLLVSILFIVISPLLLLVGLQGSDFALSANLCYLRTNRYNKFSICMEELLNINHLLWTTLLQSIYIFEKIH